MHQPTISEIDQIRAEGFRPQIVGCFLCDKKIIFVYKKKHDLWQFPQGGIDNGEDVEMAFFREMTEELGNDFLNSCDKNVSIIGEDEIVFPAQSQNSRELKNDAGEEIFMKGKKYFFVCADVKNNILDISQSEFDDFRWVSFQEGLALCEKIYQPGKKRITIDILNQLKKLNKII
ncbi:MAG TPA: NUDIX domain-containing protein [Candidatus Moranbacteria bacterium]|nr:NUDIX domain-containing protein [Candidatus Moranbacteria bacterium]